uniref:Uncharacterized protein n=1 Tax=Parascaris equorum TaxID=6256 RepID=A0A914RV15_PAREQ
RAHSVHRGVISADCSFRDVDTIYGVIIKRLHSVASSQPVVRRAAADLGEARNIRKYAEFFQKASRALTLKDCCMTSFEKIIDFSMLFYEFAGDRFAFRTLEQIEADLDAARLQSAALAALIAPATKMFQFDDSTTNSSFETTSPILLQHLRSQVNIFFLSALFFSIVFHNAMFI